MILPIRTNLVPRRTPYANYFFILANIIVFIFTYSFQAGTTKPVVNNFMLWPAHPELWQFITYAFLHANFLHIFGNMFFLYLFGNNVNDKLGNVGYISFYLAGAVFAALGHNMLNAGTGVPILGASGAVAAVTGAFLVLFPKTDITVLIAFFIITTWDISALYFIAFKLIIIDNLLASGANVAYDAHLVGYGFGIIVAILLLSTKLISPTGLDLWTMLKQWNRRRSYRDMTAQGYDPYEPRPKRIFSKEVEKPPTISEQRIMDLRASITSYIESANVASAADTYLELIRLDPAQILPRAQLLDIANHLMSSGQWSEAAQAYEKFLTHYKTYSYSEQVELMLGILYSRYLNRPKDALEHLTKAAARLTYPAQLKMCRDELTRIQNQ